MFACCDEVFDCSLIYITCTSQLRPTSIEKEIFPRMAQDDDLFAYNLSGTYRKKIIDCLQSSIFL